MDTRHISQRQRTTQRRLCPRWFLVNPVAVGVNEASILKSLWSGFITEDTVQKPASDKGEHSTEEDTAKYVLTCWRHMLQIFNIGRGILCCLLEKLVDHQVIGGGGVRQWKCGHEKHLFLVADNPEEALSLVDPGKWTTQRGLFPRWPMYNPDEALSLRAPGQPREPPSLMAHG